MKSKHWAKVEILFISDTIRKGVCVTSDSRLFSTVRDRGCYQIADLAQYRYHHVAHRSTTQGATSPSREFLPRLVLIGRSDDETGRVSTKSYSSSESSDTILSNRSRISPVFAAFFIFPFPFLWFAISLALATKILRLLLQNCEPVKQTQG